MSKSSADLRTALISLIQSKYADYETIAAAAELIAADSRFDSRMVRLKDREDVEFDELLATRRAREVRVANCLSVIRDFEAGVDDRALETMASLKILIARNQLLADVLTRIRNEYETATK